MNLVASAVALFDINRDISDLGSSPTWALKGV